MDVVLGRFSVGRKIGSGSFGEIYAGVEGDTNQDVAIKFEAVSGGRSSQVGIEAKIYKILEGHGWRVCSNMHRFPNHTIDQK
jgi:casein kinase I family protein HRR25